MSNDEEISPEERQRAEEFLETPLGKKFLNDYKSLSDFNKSVVTLYDGFEKLLLHPSSDIEKSYRKVGEFIVKFSHLEAVIVLALSTESKINSLSIGNTLISSFDFAMKTKLTLKVYEEKYSKNLERFKRIQKIIKQCYEINEWRIRVAHGTWFLGPGSEYWMHHFARSSLSTITYLQEKDELQEQIRKVDQVRRDILEFLREEAIIDVEALMRSDTE